MVKEVSSSFVKKVAYNKRNQRLVVLIQNKPTAPVAEYVLNRVPNSVVDNLLNAPSIGGFYNKNIRGQYPTYKRVN